MASDQGSHQSVTKPPALREQAEYTLLTVSSFVCDCPAPRRWLTQIIKIKSAQRERERERGAEQRKFETLNIEITCYHVTRLVMNSMQRSQRIFLVLDWFYCLNTVIQKFIIKTERFLKYETSILSKSEILN